MAVLSMHGLRRFAVFGSVWLLTAAAAQAATIYRWVDEQGRVNYSEVVPERYRSTAKPIDAAPGQPTEEQQREARERAQKERDRAAVADPPRPPTRAVAPTAPASRPAAKRPAQVPDEGTDCDTWQRLYQESIECFGPYRTVRGGVKPEAFDRCNAVSEPPSRCRPRLP